MKKLLLSASLLCSLQFYSQEKTTELNCYNKWAAKFEDRGAEDVKDGVYEDVIITNRQGSKATCHNGKAEVKSGKVIRFYILLSDGSHEEVKKTWKNKSNENVTVVGGISKSMITVHGELINILWPNKIKPKKAKPTTAPEPTDD
ncbi:MAG: hypothetical protein K0S32_2204 [Bacteroidetes bacterium]|jgi:hypothetical protein|nr:hypothetical protein [Bacteroidota bacterium]